MSTGEKISVLIIDEIAETRENIRKLLQFESDMEVVGTARSGIEGINIAKETKPDVVVMDINMPDMDGVMVTETIRRNSYFSQIIILSVQGDPNLMRRAMLAGARDFLTKPPAVDELVAAIRRAGKMAYEERGKSPQIAPTAGKSPVGVMPTGATKGKIIAVYSPKGGTGTTTLAINLAMTLQTDETKVVLVDGNLQFGDVSVFLNEQSKNTIVDLAPRADELDIEIVEEVLSTHNSSGVKILACPSRPEYAENIDADQFSKVLKFLQQVFHYVVVDTCSSMTDITLAVFDAANVIVVLTTQEIPAIKNARLFFDLADVIKIDRKRIIFTMNRFDRRIGITPEKVGESFRQDISAIIPADERVVVPSVNRGVPFMLCDRSLPISRSVIGLAEVVRQKIKDLSKAEMDLESASAVKRMVYGN